MNEVVKQDQAISLIDVIARAATDPNIDIEKMERLLQMQEKIRSLDAEALFNQAMSDAQSEMGRISADATNPQTRSKYATYGKLDSVLRPIYTRHGFALSFDERDSPKPDHIRVICYVSHKGGHTRSYQTDMPADGKGAKGGDVMTKTHAVGAAKQYGMRYLLKGAFNVAIGEDDSDGNEPQPTPAAPGMSEEQFKSWQLDMESVADEGSERLREAWGKLAEPVRIFVTRNHASWWGKQKAKAQQVGK